MTTMRQDGWLKICLGVTTFEEVAKHTPRENAEQVRKEMKDTIRETAREMDPDFEPAASKSMAEIQGVPTIELPSLDDM
jgi:hypothetical protein